jgi:hypothetical protein
MGLGMVTLLFIACQQGHPVSLYVDKGFDAADDGIPRFEKIAVLPFSSSLNHADDPDGYAPMIFEKFFIPELDARSDYIFISPGTVGFAVEREGWQNEYNKFLEDFAKSNEKNVEFLARLADALKCDAFLVPIVDAWYKDVVGVYESGSSTTTVGATITILDGRIAPGNVLFRAIDEDTEESPRAEMEDRSITTTSGVVRSDQGSNIYDAPPYEDVVPRVVAALVESLPVR